MQLVALFINLAFGIRFALCKNGHGPIDMGENGKHEQDEPAVPIDKSVLKLNSHIFKGNVLQQNYYVKRWVVLYCLPWFPPCQQFQEAYNEAAKAEQEAQNTGIWFSKVRFAQVDCATDKVLCNDMDVGMMPVVVAYSKQREAARLTWGNRNKRPDELLKSFVDKLLANDESLNKRVEPKTEFNLLNDIAQTCFAWFETSWLGRMWFGIDQDTRTLIGTLFISITIWIVVKVTVHRAWQEPSNQCDSSVTETCSPVMPHYVLFSGDSQRDDRGSTRKEVNSIGSRSVDLDELISAEELRRRTQSQQPSQSSGSIIL